MQGQIEARTATKELLWGVALWKGGRRNAGACMRCNFFSRLEKEARAMPANACGGLLQLTRPATQRRMMTTRVHGELDDDARLERRTWRCLLEEPGVQGYRWICFVIAVDA